MCNDYSRADMGSLLVEMQTVSVRDCRVEVAGEVRESEVMKNERKRKKLLQRSHNATP